MADNENARPGGDPSSQTVEARASGPDHFMRLALPRSFALDGALLEKAYFAAQRQFHPDRFATRPAPERLEALQQATAINEAYEVLKSLRGRAEHLLALAGHTVPGGNGTTVSDPALLMEALEWREALADAEDAAAVDLVRTEARERIDGLVKDLGSAFDAGDHRRAAALVLSLTYIEKLADEARRRAATLAQAKRAAS